MATDTELLVRALGEHAVSMRQSRNVGRNSTEKKAVLRWLRCLRGEELASLCCVEDVGFVKTLLHMAALSRGTELQEFQVLPFVPSTTTLTQMKRNSTKTLPRTAPREFVKRPVVQTADGDVIGCFRTREYEECCVKVLQCMRVLNALQSCDTVALSMEFFQSQEKEGRQKACADSLVYLFEAISCGDFLMVCPSGTTLKHRMWGETKWLKEQGYYPLQALFVNQIELNIWASWKRYTKDVTSKIPLQGLAAKLYLMHEWKTTSVGQRNAILRVLGAKMTEHLRDLRQSIPIQASGTVKFQAARFSLESLMRILTVRQQSLQRVDEHASVSSCFSCAFEDAVTSPQATVIKLLLAEHLQEQCSLLLSERLSNEEEVAAPKSLSAGVLTDSVDPTDKGTKGGVKGSSNHSQRRRASRKRMLKLRRRESEVHHAQQTHFSSMLLELCGYFRQKQAETVVCMEEVECKVTDATEQLVPGSLGISSERLPRNSIRSGQKRKKKKPKKKEADTTELGSDDQFVTTTFRSSAKLLTKPHLRQKDDEHKTGKHSVATTCLYSSSSQQENPLVHCNGDGKSAHNGSPRLKVSPSAELTRTTISSVSSALPTFGSQPLCLSSSTAPFFLSLAPRDHHNQPSRASRRCIDDDIDSDGGQTCLARPESASCEAPIASGASTFEWYMPFQASAQRTNSPTPALDWHFNHWQFKTSEEDMSDKEASSCMAEGADHLPPPSLPSSISPAASCLASAKISGLTKKYSLASFSKIAGIESSRRGSAHVLNGKHGLTATSMRENEDGTSICVDSDNESDFLYREGGFFDRQRALKRPRRLWPFDYTHGDDEVDIGDEHDPRKGGRLHLDRSPKQCVSVSMAARSGDAWTECIHCCICKCHRATSPRIEVALNSEADCNHVTESNGSALQNAPAPPSLSMKATEDDLVSKVTMALERISTLEEKLAEKTKVTDEQAASASSEINTLSRAVAALTAQLHNIENEIQEVQLQRAVPANTGEMDDMSLGNASSCSSPPAPFSPAPSSLNQQVDSPSAVAPTFPEAYPPTHSALGPFVSVPLSVLPPRSKLHWDLCEFAAQLQADSDSRLPAQLAAHQLCTATVQSLWPRAQVRPYGSHVTRLVLPSSDVDLVICLPKVRRDAPADAAGMLEGRNAIKETWQQNLARKLKQEPWVVSDSVKTLPHAAVPIITLLTAPPYNVRLDISFEGPGHNGLATNDVVRALLHEFPPLAPMMLILKSFAIERGLAVAYSGGLSSYALLLLVARYLQEHSDTMPNGFANASRAVQHSLSTAQAGVADFGLMLMGFLDFYGNRFDPRTTGISVASRCFLNRESGFMAGTGTSGMGDPHQVPHPYQQQYAADDAAVDDRTSQYGYCQHWQVPAQPHVQTFLPNSEGVPAHGFRRYGYRSSLNLPASQALDEMGTTTGLSDYQQLQQQTYDPHKFDPVFIEDPLCPTNNVGRNCFRIMQIRRAFSAAHLALLAASRDPAVFVDNRIDLVAGVALHPDNILRAILGAGAPVKAKPDAAMSATVGVTAYMGAEHPYGFHSYNQQQVHQQQQYAYHHHHRRPPQQLHLHHVGIPPPRSVSTCRNEPASRRHSESESEKLTTRSATSTTSRNDHTRKRHMGSPQLTPQRQSDENPPQEQVRLLRQVSTEPGQSRRLSSLHRQQIAKRFSRKNSERSMSLSLSFADVVRDGGGTNGVSVTVPKASRPAVARHSRFSRDDMALEESINERWETKVDSELK